MHLLHTPIKHNTKAKRENAQIAGALVKKEANLEEHKCENLLIFSVSAQQVRCTDCSRRSNNYVIVID
jgi:hypothetical protein